MAHKSESDFTTLTIAVNTKVDENLQEKKKVRKKEVNNVTILNKTYTFEDVVIVSLSLECQHILNCTVGETITVQNQWTFINKHIIEEQLQLNVTGPNFLSFESYKEEIISYPKKEMLIGYKRDDFSSIDNFYFCLTTEATEKVDKIVRNQDRINNLKLKNAIQKSPKQWKSMGSGEDVDYNIPKRSRGLLRVEYETKYPLFQRHLKFRMVEDGEHHYTEIITTEKYKKNILQKSRYDAETQISPATCSRGAQTTYKYPKHMWTQYKYEYKDIENIDSKTKEAFDKFIETEMDNMSNQMLVNSNLNLYTKDYENLSTNRLSSKFPITSRNEYRTLIDTKRCINRTVTCFAWNPLKIGIIAVAYGMKSPLLKNTYNKDEKIKNKIDITYFPVILWGLKDMFCPIMILESTTELLCLSFCPHDANILIGGCINGQVLYWNLKQCMDTFEKQSDITAKQQRHKSILYTVMQWPISTNTQIISTNVKSLLKDSHRSHVTSVVWIHPHNRALPNGDYICDMSSNSMQFMTSSADGFVYFWDLENIALLEKEGKKLPDNLSGTFTPFFKTYLNLENSSVYDSIRFLTITTATVLQKELDEHFEKNKTLKDQFTFELKLTQTVTQEIHLIMSNYLGDFIVGLWEKCEDENEDNEIVNIKLKIKNFGKYHDGQIVNIEQHPKNFNIYLTVGGKIFAVWDITDITVVNKPIYWRKSQVCYTYGEWSKYVMTGICLNRVDGVREIWDLSVRSDKCFYQTQHSGKALLSSATHPFKTIDNVFALAELQGTVKIMNVPDDILNLEDKKEQNIIDILKNNSSVKIIMTEWQDKWILKYASHILEEEKRLLKENKLKEKAMLKEMQKQKKKQALEMERLAKLEIEKRKPPPGRKAEWAHEKWIANEKEYLTTTLLKQKDLSKEVLVEQEIPIKILKAEKQKLVHRKLHILKKSDEIFGKTVSALFPFAIKQDSMDDTSEGLSISKLKNEFLEAYNEVKVEADKFIYDNPYEFDFKWSTLRNSYYQKKQKLSSENYISHKLRYRSKKKSEN